MAKVDYQRMAKDFTYHPPFGDQAERYGQIRAEAKKLAIFCTEKCPESRELSITLTKIDEAVFWANAAIARNEAPTSPVKEKKS